MRRVNGCATAGSGTITMSDPNMNPGDQAAPGTPGTGENVCPACGGSGQADGQQCDNCGGTGKIVEGISGG